MNKGLLIPIGGNEYKSIQESDFKNNRHRYAVLERVLAEAGGKDSRIEIIPTASMIADEIGEIYVKVFSRLGCSNVGVLHIKQRRDALVPDYLERVKNATCLFMSGGNQLKLSTILGGTTLLKEMIRRHENEGLLVAGTSAGAMAMSSTMIYQGKSGKALHRGEIKLTTGLGFIKNAIIDSHFVNRGRFGRLIQAVVYNPTAVGIGLAEDTGAVIQADGTLEVIGTGQAVVFEGHHILQSNLVEADEKEPLFVENITLHSLVEGTFYHLHTHEVNALQLYDRYYDVPPLLTT